jgi:SAM-dependent methyltransferase
VDILSYNRNAWDSQVEKGNDWTKPVSPERVEAARNGDSTMVLTPQKPVPKDWLGDVKGKKVLCLASGGGQQGPIFAALGADVTVIDNSTAQLAQDKMVAERDGLTIHLEQGDMRDLSRFPNGSFDLIFHPVSNVFIDDVTKVWRECNRVLKKGGVLLAGFCNPLLFIFDMEEWDKGNLEIKYSIPYSDLDQLPREQLQKRMDDNDPLEFGHSLESQIGGQIEAGFAITGFYEDKRGNDLLDPYIAMFIATRAVKT